MFKENELYQQELAEICSENLDWHVFDNRTVFIVGASGMFGTMLTDVLMARNTRLAANIRIIAAGRSYEHAKQRFSEYFGSKCFNFIQLDINSPITLDLLPDFVFYCASNTHPVAYAEDPVGTILTNIIGYNNLLEYVSRKNRRCKILYFSSVEVYGENRGDVEAFAEDYCGYIDCNTLRAGYPEGKRVGESLSQAYIKKYDMDIRILRLSRLYGPTMRKNDSKALSQFITKAVDGENIILKSGGLQKFSFCYAADAVLGVFYVLFKGRCGQAYNICEGGAELSLKELARFLAEIAGISVEYGVPEKTESAGYSKVQNAVMSNKKICDLGWFPRYSIRAGLERTLAILKDTGQTG